MKKIILIVGGTSGIGESLVENTTRKGHEVWATSRSGEADRPVDGVHYLPFDTQHSEWSLDVDILDGLVYCPGSINLRPFHRLSRANFMHDFEVNTLGAVTAIQAALPSLKKSAGASIVLFSTVAVGQGMPFHASIASAKGAIEGLGKSLAAELAPKIRVNVIAPSLVDTPLASKLLSSEEKKEASGGRHPLKRVGEAEDVASLASFLLLDDSTWITGQTMHIDGGMSSLRLL